MKRALVAAAVVLMTATGLATASSAPATAHGGSHRHQHHHGYTQVAVAPAVYDLVTSAGITAAPTGGATAFAYKGTLAARFPITCFRLRDLQIKHSGGLSLTAGSASINLSDFDIDLARLRISGVVSGTVGDVGRVDLFKIRPSDRPDLGLTRLVLTGTAASALNATFGVNAFAEDATFGYATPRPFTRS